MSRTDRYTGAEIAQVCREAALNALRVDIEASVVTEKDLDDALRLFSASVYFILIIAGRFYRELNSLSWITLIHSLPLQV